MLEKFHGNGYNILSTYPIGGAHPLLVVAYFETGEIQFKITYLGDIDLYNGVLICMLLGTKLPAPIGYAFFDKIDSIKDEKIKKFPHHFK